MLYFCSVRYFNVHTHTIPLAASEVAIVNGKPQVQGRAEGLFSCGLHPWFLEESQTEEQWKTFQLAAEDKTCCAIGECGLDKVCTTNWSVQVHWFERQIIFANEVKKPLIIHCVKCFNELISIKKIVRPKIPMIVHGFNNSPMIAQILLEKGFYISLGSAILQENSNAAQILSQIPLEKLFFETDDKDISISEIYEKASFILKTPLNKLEDIIFANYLEICV